MKTTTYLSILALATVVVLSGCKKQKARKTLIGEWNVTEYYGNVYNNCYDYNEPYYSYGNALGTMIFEKRSLLRDYTVIDQQDSCYDALEFKDEVDWKVLSYDRQYLVEVVYEVEIGGKTYTCHFGEEYFGEKADNQDVVYLGAQDEFGESFGMELIRIN